MSETLDGRWGTRRGWLLDIFGEVELLETEEELGGPAGGVLERMRHLRSGQLESGFRGGGTHKFLAPSPRCKRPIP